MRRRFLERLPPPRSGRPQGALFDNRRVPLGGDRYAAELMEITMRKRLTFLPLLIAGCSSPGALVQRHEPDAAVGVHEVASDGTYGLFIAGQSEPLLQYPLRAGDRLGFDTASKPAADQLQVVWLYAVAGNDRRRLDVRQTYEWRRLPDER